MGNKEVRKRKEKKQSKTKIVALFIAAFALALYLPVKGEEKEANGNSDIRKYLKGNMTLMYPSPQDTESSLSSAPKHTDVSLKPGKQVKTSTLENSLFTASLVASVVLNVADYFTTIEALKYEGLQESNPFMKPFAKKPYLFAAVKLGMIALNYKLMKSIYKKDKRIAWLVSIISNILITYVVVNNYKMIQKMQGL